MDRPTITTRQKALALNLDARTYGTFAEIGGGQEVARAFFAAGGAAGTVAKSISAYDMAVSDSLYGAAKRVAIDVLKFSGPAFAGVDNRLMSLQLVELDLTDAAMFTALGAVVQPSEVLYKKAILVERGSFRPATNLTLDLLQRAMELF